MFGIIYQIFNNQVANMARFRPLSFHYREREGARPWYYYSTSQALIILTIASTVISIYFAVAHTVDVPSPIPLLDLDEQDHNTHERQEKHKNDKTALEIKIDKMLQKQKVFVLPNLTASDAKGELSHFVLDGINQSTVLQRTFDIDDTDAVWVVDSVRFGCQLELVPLVWDVWRRRVRLNGGNLQPWDIFILDFHDAYVVDVKCIKKINTIFSILDIDNSSFKPRTSIYDDDDDDTSYDNDDETVKINVHYATRRHIDKRYINSGMTVDDTLDIPFGILGSRIDYGNTTGLDGTVRVLRYGVRSDLVLLLKRQQQMQTYNNNTDIVTWPRPNDIAHFWGVGSDKIVGKLRSAVSQALIRLSTDRPSLIVLAEQVGSRYTAGRNEAQESYAAALLQYKIVVVCQRDMWEGHYRLMEALAGGAMVMTDAMHPLPFKIEEGKEVVVYRSIAELKKLAKYFLDHEEERLMIARSGFDAVMRFHQSWTWMERIIYGDWEKEHGDS